MCQCVRSIKLHTASRTANNCTVFCQDEIQKNNVQKRLLLFMSSSVEPSVDEPITQRKDEQGTQWALSAGSAAQDRIDLLYSSIEE